MNTRFLILFFLSMVVSTITHAQPITSDNQWVIVLEDPRPARLQGWQRGNYSGGNYSQALELERTSNNVAKQYNLTIQDSWFIESLKVYCLIASIDGDENTTLKEIRANDNVKWVQLSNNFSLLPTPRPQEITAELLNPLELQLPSHINGAGIKIAMVDSAVDDQHPDLTEAIETNIDFVAEPGVSMYGESHGTAVAGVIVADLESHLGVTGIASGAKLNAYRGCWESNERLQTNNPNCNTLSLARALNAVEKSRPDILNISLSGPNDELLNQLIQKIISNDTKVVTAFDPNRDSNNRFPSSRLGVLTVQAHSLNDPSNDSFFAPGSKVVASPGERADLMHGHSIAAAYTSGVLALCTQIEAQLQQDLCQTDSLKYSNINNLKSLITKLKLELNRSL